MLLGIVAGMRESSKLDRAILMFSTVAASVPEFALGVFLASIFVVALGWLPGTATLVAGGGWSVASQLVLPVAVIVLFDAGYVVSMIRASMIEVMQRPYIRTAVLKGMSFRRVVVRHALRNAMINPVTVILPADQLPDLGRRRGRDRVRVPGLRPHDARSRALQGHRAGRGGARSWP